MLLPVLIFMSLADAAESLPFIELGATTGANTVTLPAQNDGVSSGINVPMGFAFANTTMSMVYVSFNAELSLL